MDLYSVLNPSNVRKNTSFHLIQLSKDLLNDIEESANPDRSTPETLVKYGLNHTEKYEFKSSNVETTPFLTTPHTTFKIRQQNHSNCVLLLQSDTAYLKFSNCLIVEKQSKSQVDTQFVKSIKNLNVTQVSTLADLNRLSNHDDVGCATIARLNQIFKYSKQLFKRVPISLIEFDDLLLENDLVPNFDSLLHLNVNLISILLNLTLSCFVEEVEDVNTELPESLLVKIIHQATNKLATKLNIESENHLLLRIVTNITLKFSEKLVDSDCNAQNGIPETDQYLLYTVQQGNYQIQHNKIIQFLTKMILKRELQIPLDELLIQLRLNLPMNYAPDIEIDKILQGISYTMKNSSNEVIVNYLTIDDLTKYNTCTTRFSRMFDLKPEWTIKEITPYLKDLNTRGLEIEKFARQHCRVKNGILSRR